MMLLKFYRICLTFGFGINEHAEGELDTNLGVLRFWLEDKMLFKSPHSD